MLVFRPFIHGKLFRTSQESLTCESHSLARCDTHDSRRDALVEGMDTLLLEHVARNARYPRPSTRSDLCRRLLQSRLDGVDGRVAHGSHGSADEADEGRLPAGQVGALVLRLELLEPLLEVCVCGEVDGLVASLSEGGERYSAVERADAFFADNLSRGLATSEFARFWLKTYAKKSVACISILGDVERIGHRVVLSLKTDLDDLHGRDDRNSLGDTSGQPSQESRFS